MSASHDAQIVQQAIADLRSGTQAQKTGAARSLMNLAVDADNKAAIARAGGIEPLVALARSGTDL